MKAKDVFKDLQQHLSTGLVGMIPFLVIGGLFSMITSMVPVEGPLKEVFTFLADIGMNKFDIFVAICIANSISGKIALAPAFVVGYFSNQLGLGIFGGLVTGLLVGYLNKAIMSLKFKESTRAIFSIALSPFLVALISILIVKFLVANPLTLFNQTLTTALSGMVGTHALILAIIMGAMWGFDLGGPINKIAGVVAFTLYAEGIFWPMTMGLACFMLPSLGVGLATFFDKKKCLFTEEERAMGKTAFLLGFLSFSEPALPFMFADPKYMIPINMFTSVLLAGTYAFLGIESPVIFGPIFGFASTNKPVLGLIFLFGCVILLSVLIILRRKQLAKAKE